MLRVVLLMLLQDAVQTLQQHEAALQIQVSHLTLQNLELRRELGSGWAVAEPSVVQVRNVCGHAVAAIDKAIAGSALHQAA